MGQAEAGPAESQTPGLVVGSSSGTGTLCTYDGPGRQKVEIQITDASIGNFDDERKRLAGTGVKLVNIGGLREPAFEVDGLEAFVLSHGHVDTIVSPGRSLMQLENLAREITSS